MKPFTLLALLLLLNACSSTKPTVSNNTKSIYTPEPAVNLQCSGLRIAALNTEFMFDGTGDEGNATFDWKDSMPQAREHRNEIAKIIKQLNADILVLAEVETENVLKMLINESLQGMGYTTAFVQGKDSFTRQNMGILTRIPFDEIGRTNEEVQVETGSSKRGVSKNIWARFKIGSLPVTIVGVHFLANPSSTERAIERNAQAEVIRQFVAQESKAGRAVVVTGDLNDFDDQELDFSGNTPISKVLATIKAADNDNALDNLLNIMRDVPQNKRFTATYDKNDNEIVEEGELSAIDHLLLSPQLYRFVKEVNFVHTHNPFTATDHFPISVCLNN
jgi:exonuclease III